MTRDVGGDSPSKIGDDLDETLKTGIGGSTGGRSWEASGGTSNTRSGGIRKASSEDEQSGLVDVLKVVSFSRNDSRGHDAQTLQNRRANRLGETVEVHGALLPHREPIPANQIRATGKESAVVRPKVRARHITIAASTLGDNLEIVVSVSAILVELGITLANFLLELGPIIVLKRLEVLPGVAL